MGYRINEGEGKGEGESEGEGDGGGKGVGEGEGEGEGGAMAEIRSHAVWKARREVCWMCEKHVNTCSGI